MLIWPYYERLVGAAKTWSLSGPITKRPCHNVSSTNRLLEELSGCGSGGGGTCRCGIRLSYLFSLQESYHNMRYICLLIDFGCWKPSSYGQPVCGTTEGSVSLEAVCEKWYSMEVWRKISNPKVILCTAGLVTQGACWEVQHDRAPCKSRVISGYWGCWALGVQRLGERSIYKIGPCDSEFRRESLRTVQ